MSVLTSVGILLISLLILSLLQLVPGIFALFLHFISGKYPHIRATDLAIFYIIGVETAVALVFFCVYFALCILPTITTLASNNIFAWIAAGVFIAISIAIYFFYFRQSKSKNTSSELFISRKLAHNLKSKIPTIASRSDAFVFGLTSIIPELIFTLPLYAISTLAIIQLNTSCPERAGIIILFALVSILPLFIIYISFATNHTLADFIKFRFKNKPFFRFILALFYFIIAILIILGIFL